MPELPSSTAGNRVLLLSVLMVTSTQDSFSLGYLLTRYW
jgi:hypothetical protein